MWTTNWPVMDANTYSEKIMVFGRSAERCSRGFACEMTKKSAALSMPMTVAWKSPSFTPCEQHLYAVMSP